MGALSAMDMAEHGGVNEATMTWHLRSNHYPPHPHEMVPIAMQAIDAMNEDDPDRKIELFEGVEFRGRTSILAWEAVESLHLDAFLEVGAEVEL